MIEAALRESGGRVFGPSGAAAKLGMPRSTLESKIRSLKINKNRFKTANLRQDATSSLHSNLRECPEEYVVQHFANWRKLTTYLNRQFIYFQ